MRTWPERDRPRERLRDKGPSALGDAELLALVLGSGAGPENAVELSRRILSELGGVERLVRQGLGALASVPGVGQAKGARIVAALELGVRVVERRSGAAANGRFSCSADIYRAFATRLAPLQQEVLLVVGLNSLNAPVCETEVARGSLSSCQVEPREVFRPLIAEAAARAVVLHNHPSGDCTPSPFDAALTRRLAEAGELLGIPLIDHLVIGRGCYASLRDLGLLVDE